MNNIPKVIHYCWFGRGEKPKLAQKCIKSWKRYLPDYEIIEWNEDNFDINSNQYVKEAYECKRYAFVSDYVRLHALYNHGGIYMDTDIEVLKSLNEFLIHEAFSGFETPKSIPTGIMACKKGFKLFKEFLDYYKDVTFIKEDGTFDVTTNVVIMTKICDKYGLKKNNQFQNIKGFILYPKTYFCPLNFDGKKSDFTDKTYTIHHFAGSWHSKDEQAYWKKIKKYNKRKEFLCKYMSERNAYIILDFKWILKNKINKVLNEK